MTRLRRLAQRGRSLDAVFIVGEARSGTSILFRSLLQHPAFSTGKFDLAESFAVWQLLRHATVDPSRTPDLLAFANHDTARFADYAAAISAVALWRRVTLPLANRRPSVGTFRLSLTRAALRAYAAVATDARGCCRLVEKTANHVPFSEQLLDAFPRGRLLYVERHPIDTLTSYWKRNRSEPEAAWAAMSADHFRDMWSQHAELAAEIAERHPDRFMIIRYEELTDDSPRCLAETCRFLGEPFVPAMVDSPNLGPLSISDPRLGGRISSDRKPWADFIDRDAARHVEDALSEQMVRLRYPRYT